MSKSFINLDTEQAIISAIPALLRFAPTNSIVAIHVRTQRRTARGDPLRDPVRPRP